MLDTQTKNAITAVLAGVFVILIAFIYFKKTDERFVPNVTGGNTEKTIEEILGESNSSINETSPQPILEVKNFNAVWTANDLSFGEIKDDKYKVRKGDTLWEIAEAKYGKGFEWTKILEANKNQVGFLQDGSQALIFPGQVLVLP